MSSSEVMHRRGCNDAGALQGALQERCTVDLFTNYLSSQECVQAALQGAQHSRLIHQLFVVAGMRAGGAALQALQR